MRLASPSVRAARAIVVFAFAALSSVAAAKDIDLAFPAESIAAPGVETLVPLGVTDSDGLSSLSLVVEYDASVMIATRVDSTPLSAPLDLAVDLGTPGRIVVDLSERGRVGQDSGTILEFTFSVLGETGQSSPIDLVSAAVNGGADQARLSDGRLRVVGPTASILRLTDGAGADAGEFTVGSSLFVEVTDPDRDLDSSQADTLVVTISAAETGDSEDVTLTETGTSSGVFRSSIATVAHAVARANGSLDVRGQDSATADYVDPADSADVSSDTAAIRNAATSATLTLVDLYDRPLTNATVGAPVFVKLVDPDRNLNPGARDTVMISFSTELTEDAESISLTESAYASGEFVATGGVPTEFWSEAVADARLQVISGDRIRASYSDPYREGETVSVSIPIENAPSASVTRLLSVGGEDAIHFTLGADSVVVLIADGDKNSNPSVVDTITAELSVSGSGDVEPVILRETGAGTGTFRALLPTARAAAGIAGDGVLQGLAGATVTAVYADANEPAADRTSDSATFLAEPTSSVLRFTDATGGPLDAANVGDGVHVEVVDADQDTNPDAADEITARVDVGDTADYEPVTLVETGPATGVFRSAALPSALAAPSVPGNASLEVKGFSAAEATYVDASESGDVATAAVVFVVEPSDATLRFVDLSTGATRSLVFVGSEAAILELADADQNIDAAAAESVSATLEVADSGDSETVVLLETAPSSGVFRGSISTVRETNGVAGDGVVSGAAGSVIEATYADVRDAADTAGASATLAVRPTPSTIEATDASYFGITGLVVGQSLYLAVRDTDRNLDPEAIESVSVTVTAPSGDSETLLLSESDAGSGHFRTTVGLLTAAGAPAPGNGVLDVALGESILATYADPVNAGDVSTVSLPVDSATRKSILRLTDAFGRDVQTLLVGRDAIFATLSDPDRDLDPNSADSVLIQLLNPRTGDLEDVTLVETGASTGNFVNSPGVGLGFGSAVSPDGTVAGISGDLLAAGYTDAADPSDVSTDAATITVAAGGATARFIDAAGSTRDRYEVGTEPVFASVTDADQNQNPDVVETLGVTLTVSGSNDIESILLTETGANTGVFRNATGIASSASSVGVLGNGILEGRRGYFLEVAYVDADDSSDVARASAVFIVGLTPSSARVVDGSGRDVTVRTLVSDRVYVEVAEADKNGDRTVVEEITAEILVPARNDREVARLIETGADTGIFRSGAIPTDFRVPAIPGNFVLDAADGDTVTVRYVDADDSGDVSTDSITVRVRATASVVKATNGTGADVDRFRILRDRLYVTVLDSDENRNPATVQSILANVVNPVTGDRETVTLVETGPNSGTFRNAGGLPLGDATNAVVNDGRLEGRHLNDVRLEYSDADTETGDDSSGTAALVMLTDSETSFVTQGNYPTARYQIGVDRVYVRVEDANRNLDSMSRDVVDVVVSVAATGDYETLVLTETGPDTGRFFGPASGLRLSKNRTVFPNNGELIVGVGDEMIARYEDSMDSGDISEDSAEGGDPADADSTVPTLGEWGLILLAALLGISLVGRARRLAPAVR